MLHEPKFWATIFFLGELLGGGVAAVVESYRKIGLAAMGMATLGLLGIFIFWPEAPPQSAGVSINQKGTTTNSPNFVSSNNNTVNINPPPVKTRALSRVCTEGWLPIFPTSSNGAIAVLQMHPKLAAIPGLTWSPTIFGIGAWPTKGQLADTQTIGTDLYYRCDFKNLGEVPLVGVKVEFLVQFLKSGPVKAGSKGNPPIELSAKAFSIADILDVKETFSVYLVNESHDPIYCWFPVFATVDVPGKAGSETIPINAPQDTWEGLDVGQLAPTNLKWRDLP